MYTYEYVPVLMSTYMYQSRVSMFFWDSFEMWVVTLSLPLFRGGSQGWGPRRRRRPPAWSAGWPRAWRRDPPEPAGTGSVQRLQLTDMLIKVCAWYTIFIFEEHKFRFKIWIIVLEARKINSSIRARASVLFNSVNRSSEHLFTWQSNQHEEQLP